MSDSETTKDGIEPKRRVTFLELLNESSDFVDFIRKRREVEVTDNVDLTEILMAERHGGGWVPEEQRPKT